MSLSLFHKQRQGEWLRLAMTEEFGHLTSTEKFKHEFQDEIGEDQNNLLLDLSEVQRLNSVSLGSLMWLYKLIQEQPGGEIALTGVNELNAKMLEYSGFDQFFDIVEAAEELDAE